MAGPRSFARPLLAWARTRGRHAGAAWRARPRWWLALLSAAAFALALLRPGFSWPARVGSTLLVVDITQSMNVADMRGRVGDEGQPAAGEPITRLAYTRVLLRRVVRELPCGHSAGVGVFSERKTLVLMAPIEVCAHHAALDDVLGQLDWRMAWAADSHLFYGTYSALDEIGARWPGATLAFFTDGHQAPPVFAGKEPRFERRPGTPAGVLFGVGGLLPQPVPHTDAEGRITGYWTPEEAAAFATSGPQPTLSALDMERMAAGQDVRNRPQRPPGAGAEHLSARGDAVLAALAEITGLRVQVASDAASVVGALTALPGHRTILQRHELHGWLVGLGALALLAGLLPLRRLDSRTAAMPPAATRTRSSSSSSSSQPGPLPP
ncbi:MAG TPA: hypothetical protein VLA16_13125 [Ideonella sp.]|nr:hypothetical protein [Ideonella sp.]